MHKLEVDMEIKDGAWKEHVDPDRGFVEGEIVRIGVLPRGMVSGAPSFSLLGRLEDGSSVYLQTTWKNMALGMVALIARWGTP